jgi:hypothetical protein
MDTHDPTSASTSGTHQKIPRDVAKDDFDRFAEFARLKMDSYRSEVAQEKVNTCREHFIENVMCGRITVDEDGQATILTESEVVPSVRFGRRPNGFDDKQMDKCKIYAIEAKEDARVASVLGVAPALFNKLEHHDRRLIKEVFHLFLDE